MINSPRRSVCFPPNGALPPPPGYSYVLIPSNLSDPSSPIPLTPILCPSQSPIPFALGADLPQSPLPFTLAPASPAIGSPIPGGIWQNPYDFAAKNNVVKARKDGDESTKSEKITAILDKIEKKYREREVYNKMYETSDGSQVIRIDVRSVRALEKIEEALKEVDCPPLVQIVSLSTRYSCKKNGKKKGFNLFLKFQNDSQRTFARYILESYCYEEKLWVVKDIPPKVLRAHDEESVLDGVPVEVGTEKPQEHISRGD